MSTRRKVYVGFAVALVCLVLVGAISYLSVLGLNDSARWVDHTRTVLSRLDRLLSVVTDAETAERGYASTDEDRADVHVSEPTPVWQAGVKTHAATRTAGAAHGASNDGRAMKA